MLILAMAVGSVRLSLGTLPGTVAVAEMDIYMYVNVNVNSSGVPLDPNS